MFEKLEEQIKILEENLQMADEALASITKELDFPEDTIIPDEFISMLKEKYISKDKIKEKIERYNTYGEQPYADETINNIVISELKELLEDDK